MPSYNLQAAYTRDFGKGVPGQIANEEKYNAVSRSVETTAGIAFGAPVARGTNDHGAVLLTSSNKFIGLAVKAMAPEHRQPGGTVIQDGYPARATMSAMTEGVMYELADVAVAAGDAVYWNPTTGRYSNSATNNIAIPQAFFDTSATAAGQVVKVTLRKRVA